jgi:single-strand DNA-binding protein
MCKFRLAVGRGKRDGEEETDWLDVVCWDAIAENVNQYLDKGAMAGVEGRVQSRTWERKDGGRGYAVEINAYRVHFLESRKEAEARRGGAKPASQQAAQKPAPAAAPDIDWTMEGEEDPFSDE